MKTYFNYEAIIKSKDAAEAIGLPIGVGPFCGFGSATISNQKITINPEGVAGSVTELSVKDRILSRMMFKEDDIANTNFGVIARDGTVWVDSINSISVDIQGTQGTTDNVIVYAVHTQVQEPVENPVEFVAYWNSSSTNFYDLYKKATDPYYPRANANQIQVYKSIDVLTDKELTYDNLVSRAKAACPSGQIDDNTMVLVGIYGSGINAETETTEQFAIVPYMGNFPQPVNYSTAAYGLSQVQSQVIQQLVGDLPQGQNGVSTIKEYIDYLFNQMKEQNNQDSTLNALPSGAIIMWSGASLPDGWAYCDGLEGRPNLMGKFVVGYNPSDDDYKSIGMEGGFKETTLTLDQIPAHKHPLYYYVESDWGDNANNRPVVGSEQGQLPDYWVDRFTGVMSGEAGGGKPHDNRPPYYVLAYIIKL